MIVRIAKNGRSFKGSGLYYLHDKAPDPDTPNELKPTTNDRLSFITSRNLVFDEPGPAIAEMIRTAYAQTELKRANDISVAGRRCTEPVKTLSLSWHPDEKPTHDHMIEAADKYLKHMGWQEHQALIIGHDDTAHPHVHIVVNRVHPETGRVMDDRLEYKRSQTWALEYEKEMGRIWCENRVENAKPREESAPDRSANDNDLPHNVIKLSRPFERDYAASEKAREEVFALERDMLKREQRQEREAWFADGKDLFKEARNAVWREVKQEYSEDWKQFFAEKSVREHEAEQHSGSALDRAFYFAKTGDWDQARAAFADRNAVHTAVAAEFSERASELRRGQLEETRERQSLALDALKLERADGYRELLARQQEQRHEMREAHAAGERAGHLVGQTHAARTANENAAPDTAPPIAANTNHDPNERQTSAANGQTVAEVPAPAHEPLAPEPLSTFEPAPTPEDRAAARMGDAAITGTADLAAGAIGGTANYLADQLGELFAPTPPEVREAQAKATDKAREEAEAAKPHNPFLKHAGMAENKATQDREEKERDDYWDDRERRRER